jgi:cobalt/nickel transport system permease protein
VLEVRLPGGPLHLQGVYTPQGGISLSQIQVLDPYQDEDSLIHRQDPRVKLVVTLATIVAIAALPPGAWISYLFCLTAVVFIIGLSRVRPVLIVKRSLVAIPFALVAFTLIFTVEGTPLASLRLGNWSVTASSEGTIAFFSILIKAWLSVLVATLLVTTTAFPGVVAAMRSLRVPRVIVSVISFMYRYIFVIADEALRLHRAREARSANPRGESVGSIAWKAKVLGGMIGSLFLRSYERSERIYSAMLSRGFDGELRSLRERKLEARDILILGAFAVCLGMLVALS